MKIYLFILTILSAGQIFAQDSARTSTGNDSCFIYLPNVLTMNCESAGDDYRLHIYSDCTMQEFQIRIYNRWGEILFESTDIKEYWDASEEDEGTYIYTLCGTSISGQNFEFRGQIVLLK